MKKDTGIAASTQFFGNSIDKPISFTLFFNDLGMNYVVKEHTKHLLTTLNKHYIISKYW